MIFGLWDWIVRLAQTIAKGRDAGLWDKKDGPRPGGGLHGPGK